jgi:hypothetical protein
MENNLNVRESSTKVMRPNRPWQALSILAIWLIALSLVFALIDKSFIQVILCLIVLFCFSAWGHVLFFPMYYKTGEFLEGLVWGTISGIASAALITSIIVCFVEWNLFVVLGIVIILPALLLSFMLKKNEFNIQSRNNKNHELIPLLIALLIVTLFFYLPFKNLGALVDDKYVYAWLFGHDFINRMVHVTSLSRGLPLDSFFFAGETLSYYWLAYVYPALLLNIEWIKLDVQKILQLTVLFYSLLSVAALVLFIKNLVNKKSILLLLVILALFFYSYSGLYVTGLEAWRELAGEDHLKFFGYNLALFSGFSHTFYRFFLVQPQASLALAIMLMIFSLYRKNQTLYCFATTGLFLGILFGVDATNGIMMFIWFVSIGCFAFFFNKQERIFIAKGHLFSLALAFIVYGIFFSIEMYSFRTGRGVLQIKPNWFSMLMGPVYFPFEYGPMLLFGAAGIVKFFKQEKTLNHWGYHFVILLCIGLFFVFFVTNPTESQFGLLKATRIIPICLLAFTAYLFQNTYQNRKKIILAIVLGLFALPSFFTDNFLASNISNPSTYVRYTDMEAAKWIKRNLPPNAVVQAEPNYPGFENTYKPQYAYSLIPIFAERRTAIGEWKVSSQEHSKTEEVGERFHSVKKMFATTNLKKCIQILEKYDIDYIYVGELEKNLYPNGIKKFFSCSNFELIYYTDNVSIFKYKKLF